MSAISSVSIFQLATEPSVKAAQKQAIEQDLQLQQDRFLQIFKHVELAFLKELKALFGDQPVGVVFTKETADYLAFMNPLSKPVHIRFLFEVPAETIWAEIKNKVLALPHQDVKGFYDSRGSYTIEIDSSLIIEFAAIDADGQLVHPHLASSSMDCRCFDFTPVMDQMEPDCRAGVFFSVEGYDLLRSLDLSLKALFEIKPGSAAKTREGLEYYCSWITEGKQPVAYKKEAIAFSAYESEFCKGFYYRYILPASKTNMYANLNQFLMAYYPADLRSQFVFLINFLEVMRRADMRELNPEHWKSVKQLAETTIFQLLKEKFNFSENEDELLQAEAYLSSRNPIKSHPYGDGKTVSRISIQAPPQEREECKEAAPAKPVYLVVGDIPKLKTEGPRPFMQTVAEHFPNKELQIQEYLSYFSTVEFFSGQFEKILGAVESAPEAFGQKLLEFLKTPTTGAQRAELRSKIDRLVPKLVHCSCHAAILETLSEQSDWFTAGKAHFLFSAHLKALIQAGKSALALKIFTNLSKIEQISPDLLVTWTSYFFEAAAQEKPSFEMLCDLSLKGPSCFENLRVRLAQTIKKMDPALIDIAWVRLIVLCNHYHPIASTHAPLKSLILQLIKKAEGQIIPVKELRAFDFLREDKEISPELEKMVPSKKKKKKHEKKQDKEVPKPTEKPQFRQEHLQRFDALKKNIKWRTSIFYHRPLDPQALHQTVCTLPLDLQRDFAYFLEIEILLIMDKKSAYLEPLACFTMDLYKKIAEEVTNPFKEIAVILTLFKIYMTPETRILMSNLDAIWKFMIPRVSARENQLNTLIYFFKQMKEKILTEKFPPQAIKSLFLILDFLLLHVKTVDISQKSLCTILQTTTQFLAQFKKSPMREATRRNALELCCTKLKDGSDEETNRLILDLLPEEIDADDAALGAIISTLKATVPILSTELDAAMEHAREKIDAKTQKVQELVAHLGESFVQQKWEEVIADYKQIIVLHPVPDPHVLLQAADAYIRGSEKKKAIDLLENGLKKYPQDIPILLRLGNFYRELGKQWEEKRRTIGRISVVYQRNQDRAKKRLLISVRHLTTAHEAIPEDPCIGFYLAQSHIVLYSIDPQYSKKGIYAAEDLIKKHLEKKPENDEAWGLLGCVQSCQGKYEEAVSSLKKAIIFKSDDKEYYLKLIEVYLHLSSEKAAFEILEEAFEKWPDDAHLIFFRGAHLLNLQNVKGAAHEFSKTLTLSGNNLEYYMKILNLYVKHDCHLAALDILQKGIETHGEKHHLSFLGIRGACYAALIEKAQKDNDYSARKDYRKQLAKDADRIVELEQKYRKNEKAATEVAVLLTQSLMTKFNEEKL